MKPLVTGVLLTMGIASSAALSLALSLAWAASGDQAYCEALSELYLRYIGNDETAGISPRIGRSPTGPQVAVALCREGRAAEAIPELERILRANRFTLPKRD
ncbi:MAG: hypothetical protein JOY81_00330 [Alphaproteobacteria bacterium]|nr:hypothetical protein [Alphaproteobacteria bacterium]